MKILKRIKVYGKVQGVFYRASTQRKAEQLTIKGWVRNEADGSVLIEAEASPELVNELIQWCHSGPPGSNVEKVEVTDGEVQNFLEFKVLR